MFGPESGWPEYKEFMVELTDPRTARDFLSHIMDLGYVINELLDTPLLKDGETIEDLSDEVLVNLAQTYWPMVFLAEYPDYGEYEQ
jgi:hypothetical protein